MPYLLVMESDHKMAAKLQHMAESLGYAVGVADEIKDGLLTLQQRPVGALVIDLAVYEAQKEELAQASNYGSTPIIALTNNHSKSTKNRAKELGTLCLLNRSECLNKVEVVLSELLENIYNEKYGLNQGSSSKDFGLFVGQSKAMQQLYTELERVAKTDITVMLIGESGTGKELAALAVHQYSDRKHQVFMPLNCGAISCQLIESELFGHEKGSFTGADKMRQGYFELADTGTLFLDEITEMPLEMQVRLLRVLETGHFARVGGAKSLKSNARIITATNRNPAQAVTDQKLREDLYYRLNILPIFMPPLRQREGDVMHLAKYFLAQINEQYETSKRLSGKGLKAMEAYHWPGNVRELRNAIWRGYVLSDTDQLDIVLGT